MLTTNQLKLLQQHLQAVMEQSVSAELKYMMEEDAIPGLFDEIDRDDIVVRLKIAVSNAI